MKHKWIEQVKCSEYMCDKSGYNMYRGWKQIEYQNRHYNMDQNDEGT